MKKRVTKPRHKWEKQTELRHDAKPEAHKRVLLRLALTGKR